MEFWWERHLIGFGHPGVWIAVIVASPLSWLIGKKTAALVLHVRDPWRRIVYLTLPVLIIALFLALLPSALFEIAWFLTHPRNVHADLYFARYALVVPLFVAVASAGRHIQRSRVSGRSV